MNSVAIRPALRLPYLALTTLFLAAAIFETAAHGFPWQLPVFAVGADLALLAGAVRGLAPGQLHPRAVPFYNAVHRLAGPVALLVAAQVLGLSVDWFIAGLAWATHVTLDRALGYGLRTRDGFQRS
jgi:uncharacterized protein DUF4260